MHSHQAAGWLFYRGMNVLVQYKTVRYHVVISGLLMALLSSISQATQIYIRISIEGISGITQVKIMDTDRDRHETTTRTIKCKDFGSDVRCDVASQRLNLSVGGTFSSRFSAFSTELCVPISQPIPLPSLEENVIYHVTLTHTKPPWWCFCVTPEITIEVEKADRFRFA